MVTPRLLMLVLSFAIGSTAWAAPKAKPRTPKPVPSGEFRSFYSVPPAKVSPRPRRYVPLTEKRRGQHMDFDGYSKTPPRTR